MAKRKEPPPESGSSVSGRLESWKEIADYLKRDKRTVQRWEKEEGLPVHRHRRRVRSSVFAFRDELEEWLRGNPVAVDPITLRTSRRRFYISLGLFVLSIILGSAGFYVFSLHTVFTPGDTGKLPRTVTDYRGQELQPTVSPGSNNLAFVWNGSASDNFDIYVQPLTESRAERRTTSPEIDYSPIWSRDGASIAFLRRVAPNRASVVLMPALSGTERVVNTVTVPPWEWGTQLSWSKDGLWIAFGDGGTSGGSGFGISLVNVVTGEIRAITVPEPTQLGDHSPVFSPDGSSLLFTRNRGPNNCDLFRVDLSDELRTTGKEKRLTSFNAPFVQASWSACGRQVLVAVGSQGKSRLWRVSADGSGVPELNPVADQGVCCPVLFSDHRLIYSRRTLRSSIRQYPWGESSGGKTVLVSSGSVKALAFSGSRNAVAFASDRFGHEELWMKSLNSEQSIQLTQFGQGWIGHMSWSPDGQRIAFDSSATGHSDLYTISVEVPVAQTVTSGRWLSRVTESHHEELMPSWSRDGRSIYFSSNRAGGFQIWQVPAAGGEPVQVTQNGGLFGIEGPDAACLYFTKWNAPGLWRLDFETGTESRVLPSCSKHFAASSEGIFYAIEDGVGRPRVDVEFYRFSTKQVERVEHFESRFGGGLEAVPDGSAVFLSQVEDDDADLLLVDHFHCRLSGGVCEKLFPWL